MAQCARSDPGSLFRGAMDFAPAFAESVRATWYPVLLSELFFKIVHRGYPSGIHVGKAALDSREPLQFVQLIEKLLIGGCILNNNLGLPVNGQHHGMAALPHPFEEAGSVAFEGAERLDVFGDIEHKGPALNLHQI
ncbi:hypothetical protein SBA4_3940023 [Candidatus Sulfopaludibacter sp. SbA4]|nr:hypothetical protein SBA4_3940023 [Candidatus Sulfopaludibacter sp. SbA4]